MFRGLSTIAASSIVAALLFVPVASRATTMVQFNEEDLTHIADAIVIADVQSAVPELRYSPSGARLAKQITTKTTLKVVDAWKGPHAAGDLVEVRQIGGIVGKEMAAVPGAAGFMAGERVLVFLSYRPQTNEYGIVGWTQGKYTLLKNQNGGWDVAKITVAVEKWGTPFVAAEYENRAVRGSDLPTFSGRIKRVVEADAKANVNWREMPQYKGLAFKKGGAQ